MANEVKVFDVNDSNVFIRPYEHNAKYYETDHMEIISPVLSISCEYRSMTRFTDTVIIEPKIVKYNGIKMEFEYRITDKKTGELRATGKSEHCFLNRAGTPISLKRSYPELDTKFFEFV